MTETDVPEKKKPDTTHEGHRGRLIAKFESGGLEEHEWLEGLLFNAYPRKNTNPVAHALLRKFDSIENIFTRTTEQLQTVEGIGPGVAAYLRVIGVFFKKFRSSGACYPKYYDVKEFVKYARREYSGLRFETFDMYFLDKKMNIVCREEYGGFSETNVAVPTAAIGESLVIQKPKGVILVHNHPKESALPSDADNAATKVIQMICSTFDVLLCDHFIVSGKEDVYSYYAVGEMSYINENYSLQSIFSSAKMYEEAKRRQRECVDRNFRGEANEKMRLQTESLRDGIESGCGTIYGRKR